MSWTERLLAGPSEIHDYWYQPYGYSNRTTAGVVVTPDNALQCAALWACGQVISEDVAGLPLPIYRRLGDGRKEEAREHPLWDLLNVAPNPWQTAFEFRQMIEWHILLFGNFYAEILAGRRGAIDQLVPLPAWLVTHRPLSDGTDLYEIKAADGSTRKLTGDEVWHVRHLSLDGRRGVSPVTYYARENLGLVLAVERSAQAFYGSGSSPGIVFTTDKVVPKNERAEYMREWNEENAGPSRHHKVNFVAHGLTPKFMGISPKESQALETRQHLVEEVCRWTRVKPHKIAHLLRATFSNIEQQSIEHVQDTILPRCKRMEASISKELILAAHVYFAEHNVDGLLRGDIEARYAAYATGRQWGWLSANDVRRRENMNPIEDGDEYLSPMNMVGAGDRRYLEPPADRRKPEPSDADARARLEVVR
jgi:HK97 family phage portal protein